MENQERLRIPHLDPITVHGTTVEDLDEDLKVLEKRVKRVEERLKELEDESGKKPDDF